MNLEERIEAAWKEHCSVRYYATERETDDAEDEFKSGYRAAMRSLYVEIGPEYVLGGVDYWAVVDGQWQPVWWFSDEYARKQAGDCEAIVEADIPSPAEIF